MATETITTRLLKNVYGRPYLPFMLASADPDLEGSFERTSRKGPPWVLGLWAALVLVGGSSLMAAHLAALPTPAAEDPHLVAELARDGGDRWTTVHVLAAGCGCSRAVVEHLARRGPNPNVRERILWVTTKPNAPAPPAAGFAVEVISPADLRARLGVVGVPTLLVGDPAGHVRYVGGYTARKQSPRIADLDILGRLERGETVEPFPVLGCALDPKTARRLDPLGLR